MKKSAVTLLVVSGLWICAAPAFSGGEQCVVGPEELAQSLSQPPEKMAQVGSGTWIDGVFVLPFAFPGPYDKEAGGTPNGEPRRWVAESFFDKSPDAYDFVVVFTNFEWDSGAAAGVYWSVANDTQGIGLDFFDFSQFWGSENLQGYIDGRMLSDYIRADGSLDEERLHIILNHEIGHRWLVHPDFLDDGTPSSSLLGADGSHWSYLLDSEASYMYGSEWSDNGDGTFTATGVEDRYSHLDLYLMGILPPEEVPDFTLLVNPAIAGDGFPRIGDTIEATTQTISVFDVIGAEGPRIPDSEENQHEFRVGLIYLVDPAIPPTASDIDNLNTIRASWEESFFRETGGNAIVDVASPFDPPIGGSSVDLAAAVQWLVAAAGAGGGVWSDSAVTWVRETAEAVEALDRIGGQAEVVEAALAALLNENPVATELEARRLIALARQSGADLSEPAEALVADMESDGGWAAFPRYVPDNITTARASRALMAAGANDVAIEAWAWLEDRQNPDGGWGWQAGLQSTTLATEEVILTARRLLPDYWDLPAVQVAVQWLLDFRVDGGFGEPFPNIEATAQFLLLSDGQDLNQTVIQEAVDFLVARQQADGSWASSAHATALAVNALASFALPDPYVEGARLFADPENPFDDDEIDLVVAVRNSGLPLDAGAPYRWEVRLAAEPAVMIWARTGELPAVPDVGFVSVATTLSPPLSEGVYDIRFVIDPNREIAQRERANDVGSLTLEVRSHPEGIDLQLLDSNLGVDPSEITSIPQPLTVSGIVENLGLSDATGVVLRVFDGDPGEGLAVGETVVTVPALGLSAYSIPVVLSEARSTTLSVVADPDGAIEDEYRFNNVATRAVPLRNQVDLEVVPGSLTATPPSVSVGEPLALQAVVQNAGTVEVADFEVVFSYEWGSPADLFLIESLTVSEPLAPGETTIVSIAWSPNVDGDPLLLQVDVDPTGTTGDADLANNRAQLGILVSPSDLPNLIVGPQSFALTPGPPLQGAPCQIDVIISNPTINAAGPFAAELWLDAVGTGTLLGSQSFAGVDAGATAELSATWNVVEPTDRLLYVVVDGAGAVEEFREDDNQAFVEADVQTLPDLVVTGGGIVFQPSFPRVGDTVHFEVLVGNQGDQVAPVSLLELVAEDGSVIDSVVLPGMDGHTELSLGLDWATGTFVGDASLTVRADYGDAISELFEDNNEAQVSIGVQDADIFLSKQIFSPNGDGVKDTTEIFYRVGGAVQIQTVEGRLLRTLLPEDGQEFVVWDGLSDRGNLVPDALYVVAAGEVSSWVVVDSNRFAITQELDQRLLVGFLQPRVPGEQRPADWDPERNIERSWFISLISSPVSDEIYLVERYHAEGTDSRTDTFKLWMFAADQMVELGDLPEQVNLLGVDFAGTQFVTGSIYGGPFQLLRVPEMTLEDISPPSGWGYVPWISPDGQWLLWASRGDDNIHLHSLVNADESYTFSPEGVDDSGICGYSVFWTPREEAVVSLNTWSGTGYYYHVNTATIPPTASSIQAQDWTGGCGGGGGGTAASGGEGGGEAKHEVGRLNGPDTGLDFDLDTLTWLTLDDGGYGGYGDSGLNVSVFELEDGAAVEDGSLSLDAPQWSTIYSSMANDGKMVTTAWEGGGEKRAGENPAIAAENLRSGALIWFDVPENLIPQAGKAYSPVDQFLSDWRSQLDRGLPLRLEDTLWTPADTYIVGALDPARYNYSDNLPYFTPAANLKMRVKPRVLFGDAGVDLWVLATDRYLESYLLEYSNLDGDPDAYQTIGLPSNEALYGQRWGTWIPPGNGRYRVRITGHDRAGNVRSHSRRVTWNGDNDIANLYTESRYLSPRSSVGVQDSLIFHYTVLRPANLLFTIVDSEGESVAEIAVAADEIGPMTSTWDGTDTLGNPVSDGAYLLTFGEASWPVVVDNTLPQAALRFDETGYARSTHINREVLDSNGDPTCEPDDRDEYINELFGSIQDLNLRDWEYQVLIDEAEDLWRPLAMGTDVFGTQAEMLMGRYGAEWVTKRRVRFVARDLAGNETISEASYRNEWIRFTDSEPSCRRSLNPCLFPERPDFEELADEGGLFEPSDTFTLNPYYDTLLVQGTVWTDLLELRLEYREASIAGLPAGPWVQGSIEVSPVAVYRGFRTIGWPFNGICPDSLSAVPAVSLTALYWDHPELGQTPVDVRLAATNEDGQEIVSEPRLFYPEVPLALRHIGVQSQGDIFRLTNLSNGVVRDTRLQIRRQEIVDGAVIIRWEELMTVVDRLGPGEEAVFATGCILVQESEEILRVQGTGGYGGGALSNLAVVPYRDGFSTLHSYTGSGFRQGSCPSGSPVGGGLFGVHNADPCPYLGQEPEWPVFWVNNGSAAVVEGHVAADPSGALFANYEILVDGQPLLTVPGELLSAEYIDGIDLSQLSDGTHSVTERYSYAGQPGLLGQCPQSFTVTIDRTPPVLAVSSPLEGAFICPDDAAMTVTLADQDATSGRLQKVFLDGAMRATSAEGSCAEGTYHPFSGGDGSEYSIDKLYLVEPGWHEITAQSVDRAGFASCSAPVSVYIPELPHIQGTALPPVFSPLNTMDRPLVNTISFTTGTPGTWTFSLEKANTVYQAAFGDVSEPDEEVELLWDGTVAGGGSLAQDGVYYAYLTARSPCGAEDSARLHLELDTTPPMIEIDSPIDGAEGGAVVEVFGRVFDAPGAPGAGDHFQQADVEVFFLDGGSGEWTVVASRRRELEDEAGVIGTWRTSSYLPGDYLIRVRAWDQPGNVTVSSELSVSLPERQLIDFFDRQPELFSPNSDGVLDTDFITFGLLQEAVVTLLVVDGTGARVATLFDQEILSTPPEGRVVEWSGATDGGETAADGTYMLVLRAEDPATPPSITPEEERLTLVVDTTPPVLALTNPAEDALVPLPLDFIGSHDEIHPEQWTLSLTGPETDEMVIGAGSGAFGSRTMAIVEDGQVEDGAYVALFEATDAAGNRSSLVRRFTIDNTLPEVEILSPEVGVVVNTINEPLELQGEVRDAHLREWSWGFAAGLMPDLADFSLFRTGGPTQADGAFDFHAWDASNLIDGVYTLRLSGIDELNQQGEARRPFTVDNTPPTIAVTLPSPGAVITDPMEILGSVEDEHLKTWTLTLIPPNGEPVSPPMAAGSATIDGSLVEWILLPADGAYTLHLEAKDAAGNFAELDVDIQIQTTPPSPPVILSADVVDQGNVSLVWTPGPGPAPDAYNVYRDGILITPVPVTETTLYDASLATGTYVYTVRALNQFGNETEDSNPAEVIIDLRPPLAKIVLPGDGARVSDQVSIFGTASRETGFAGWQLWATFLPSGGPVLLGSGTASIVTDLLAVWDTSQPLWVEGTYELRLEASDIFGNTAIDAVTVEVDNTAPQTPVLTVAFAQALDPDATVNDIHVEWALDPPPPDLAGFYLYRNGQLANAPGPVLGSQAPFLISGTAYDDRDLADGTYVYFVTAADTAENESGASNESDPIVIDTRRPHAVIVDPPDGAEFEQSTPVTAECEDLDVESVVIEYMPDGAGTWTPLGPPFTTPSPWTIEFEPGAPGLYHVRAVASDALGPDPAPESVALTEVDLPPDAPEDLSLHVDGGDIHLEWTAVADPYGDLEGYRVYRDGDLLTTTPLAATQLAYDDLDLADDWYNYRVSAVDAADHESGSAYADGSVTTPQFDFLQPIVSADMVVLEGRSEAYFDQVEFERSGSGGSYESMATLPFADSSVVYPSAPLVYGYNSFRMRGSDDAGNRSRWSRPLVLVRHDPPTEPQNVAAAAAGSDVQVDWDASADPDLFGYIVRRDGAELSDTFAPYPYEPTAHELLASGGVLADWQLVIDGNDTTAWQPDVETARAGPSWQWTWDDPIGLQSVRVRWADGAYARRFSVEVEIDGHWLWWYYRSSNWSTEWNLPVGIEATGLRLSVPPGSWCNSCALAEVSLESVEHLQVNLFQDPGLPDQAYEYGVRTLNRWAQESPEASANVQVGGVALAPPENLLATPGLCGEIALSWGPPVPLPAIPFGYRIYRATELGALDFLVQVPADRLDWLDSGLAEGVTYRYHVTALAMVDGVMLESDASNEASAIVECTAVPPPLLNEPTVAGVPIDWPANTADIGGRAWPGSDITLLHDGSVVGGATIEAGRIDEIDALPSYGSSGQVLALSQDGRVAAYRVDDGESKLVVRDLVSGETRVLIRSNPGAMDLSPNGDRLAFIDSVSYRDEVFLADLETDQVVQLTDDGDDKDGLSFSPDGRWIAFVAFGNQPLLQLFDTTTGSLTTLYNDTYWDGISWPAFSPDGQFLVFKKWYGWVILGVPSGEERTIDIDSSSAALSRRPVSADGRFLCWTEYPDWVPETAIVKLYDLVADEFVEVLPGQVGVFAPNFVDEDTIAFLRFLPAKADPVTAGDLEVVYLSLADRQERPLTNRVAREAIAGSYDDVEWSLMATSDGPLCIPQQEEILKLYRPTGRFTIPEVTLHPGVNTFVARQLFEGLTADSEPIEVNVAPELFGDAEVLAVGATPAFPLSGDAVLIDGVVRNSGQAELEDLLVTLVRVDSAGVSHAIQVDTVDLAPGAYHRMSSTWDTTGLSGDNLWVLSADAADTIPEIDEHNNSASVLVPLRLHAGIEAGLSTPQTEYQLGDLVPFEVTVSANGTAEDWQVQTRVETSAGELVEVLEDRLLEDFGFQSESWSLSWPSDRVYPGSYRGRVIVTGSDGETTEATVDFDLIVVTAVEALGTADRPSYRRGDRALFEATIHNTGRALVVGARVQMTVETIGGGTAIATEQRDLTSLPSGAETSLTWSWTTEAAPLGLLQFVVRVLAESGETLALSTPYPFIIESDGAALAGSIEVDPGQMEPGGNLAITGAVENLGDQGLTNLEVTADIIDPESGSVVAQLTDVVELPPGSTAPLSWDYTPTMTRLGSYVVLLSANRQDVIPPRSEALASSTFTLVDLTPPDLVVLDPEAGAVCDIVDIRARATDALSSVVRVTFTLDDQQPAILMNLESVEDTVYASRWFVQPNQIGTHTIAVSAEDAAGNIAGPIEIEIEALDDQTPPLLEVFGPEDGTCVPGPVSVTFSADDDHLLSITATLDGAPYASGEAIPDGPHLLVVTAIDVCGHIVDDLRTFVVDSVAPAVVVTGVEDGGQYLPPVNIAWTVTDENLRVESATLNGAPVLSPLTLDQEGSYLLEVSGIDCAGNQSTESLSFVVGPDSVDLASQLEVTPLEVEPPQAVDVSASVENQGLSDLQAMTIGLRLVDPLTGDTVALRTQVNDVAVGASVSIREVFDTAGLSRQTYRMRLEASGVTSAGSYNLVLAVQSFEVVDLTPPEVLVISPAAGLACDPVAIRVEVVDGFSGVEAAWARIDGATDLLELEFIPGDPDPGHLWGADFSFGPDAGGLHQLELFAGDFAANTSTPVGVEIDVDVEPPVLDLEAPADGACLADPVTIIFSATDANLVLLEAILNGEAISSGAVVDGDGAYELEVTARDGCGLEVVSQTSFIIDTVAPVLTITGVEDGGVYSGSVEADWVADDINLSELSATLDGEVVTPPLTISEEGEHVLVVTAEDCAGNTAQRTLSFSIEGQPPLELSGVIHLGANVVNRGDPLAILAEISNDGAAAVDEIQAQIWIVESATGRQVGSTEALIDLPVGASESLADTLDTSSLHGGWYRVELWVSGEYAGAAYEDLLDQVDFELMAPAPIPVLGNLGRIVMIVLLMAAGVVWLRRSA